MQQNPQRQCTMLAEQFTQFYYQNFMVQAQRPNLFPMYAANCSLSYNGRLYQGHAGVEELFQKRFQLGDIQMEPTSISACPAGEAVMINVLGRLLQPSDNLQAIFSQSFLLMGDGNGNFSILSDVFAIDMMLWNHIAQSAQQQQQ